MTQRRFTAGRFLLHTRTFCAAALALALTPGCVLDKQDTAAEYREALPGRESVVVAGPGAGASADGETAAATSSRRAQADRPLGRTDFAEWYLFTRAVQSGVNAVTAWALGSAWVIVQSEPTSVRDGEAIWGPYTDSLEPVTYRFRVTRVADAEYAYVLEGRPKASQSDEAYRTVLDGHGFGRRHEQHGEGELTIDLDAARELDPFGRAEDSGTVHLVHRLPHDLAPGARPRTIEAAVTPDPSVERESYTVRSVANEDGTGTLRVVAKTDLDEAKASALEDVTVESRFRADGAGRADIVISGGDLPREAAELSAVECWGADFARSYYASSLSSEPTEGEASACVYGAP